MDDTPAGDERGHSMELILGWERLHKDQDLLQVLVGDFGLGIWRWKRRITLMFLFIHGIS